MKNSTLETAVTAARALAHPARLRIVAMLRSGELCVCQITEVVQLAPSTVSAHLKELRLAGLITERKAGKWVHFRLADHPDARAWIDTSLAAVGGDRQLETDHRLVRELREVPVEDLCKYGLEAARSRAAATTT